MRLPWQKTDRSRVFEVECECGEIFRVPFHPEDVEPGAAGPLLVPLAGRCPWCGLRLEAIDPFESARRDG